MPERIEILLADDHEIYRDGFKLLFKKNPDIEVVGEACNGEQLIKQAIDLRPDIIITDIHMPVMNGIEATWQLTQSLPETAIIALSMANEESQIVEMLEAGAKGYLLKNAHKREIIAAINAVYNKQNYYCESTGNKLARMITESKFHPARSTKIPVFSDRDIEVMQLICQEYSYQQIGEQMNLSKRTIEWYAERLIEKIEAKNQAGIIVYALRHHIFK